MHNLSRTKKLLLVITASIVVIAAVSAATLFVLTTYLKKPSQDITPVTAQQIIESYQQTHSADNLAAHYAKQDNSTKNVIIDYSASDAPYDLQLDATHSVTYSKDDPTATDAVASLTTNAETFMTNHGLTKTTSIVTTSSTQALYDGALSVCQVTSFPAVTNSEVANIPASFGIGCIDKTAVTSAYNDVNSLVALYRQTQTLPTITHVSRAVVNDEKTPITVLYISTDATKMTNFRAYFTSIDNQSTYLGTASVPAANSDQPSVRSAELVQSMADPRYGAFLTQLLEKY